MVSELRELELQVIELKQRLQNLQNTRDIMDQTPVPTVAKNNKSAAEAEERILESLSRAVRDGKYLVAIWSVDKNDGLSMLTRTTWNFPRQRLLEALQILEGDVRQELVPPRNTPLPDANLPISELAFVRDDKPKAEIVVDISLSDEGDVEGEI